MCLGRRDQKDEILEVQSGISFFRHNKEKVVPSLLRSAPPMCLFNQTQEVTDDGRVTSLRFFVSQPLRNLTAADNDLSGLITVAAGGGDLDGDVELSSSRSSRPSSHTDENRRLKCASPFYTNERIPKARRGGISFLIKPLRFTRALPPVGPRRFPASRGANAQLEGVATGVTFEAGAFGMWRRPPRWKWESKARTPWTVFRRARLGAVVRLARSAKTLGVGAYPSPGFFRAVSAAPTVSPLSAFDIFLPAGINHLLKKDTSSRSPTMRMLSTRRN